MTSIESRGFKPIISLSFNNDIVVNFNEKLGEWTYGLLYRGYSKSFNRGVMVKIVDLPKFPLNKACLDNEIAILKKLEANEFVTKFLEHKRSDNTLTIVTEICNKGSLKEYLRRNGRMSEDKALRMLLQIIHGLKDLHELKFSHGDLRPENILLHQEKNGLTTKISNFIFARAYDAKAVPVNQLPSNSLYLPPEVLKTRKYNPKSDIWSLGAIYYEMLYGQVPWPSKNTNELYENIKNKKLDFPEAEGISRTSISFISKCLERELDKRFDWGDVMQHRLIFRGLFSRGDGTFKLFNDKFKETTPINNNLVYGMRRNTPEKSFSNLPPKPLPDSKRPATSFKRRQISMGSQKDFLDNKLFSHNENDLKETLDTEALLPDENQLKLRLTYSSSTKATRKNSCESVGHIQKKLGIKFYEGLLDKTGVAQEPAKSTVKHIHRRTLSTSSNNALNKSSKLLSYKAGMLGEIQEIIQDNKQHPLYEKIVKILENEAKKLNQGVNNTMEAMKDFNTDIAKAKEERVKTEENLQNLLNRRRGSRQALAKKEKSKEIYELLREITLSLIEPSKNGKNNEDILKIAANFKVLREFNDIGENEVRDLESLKDILLVFYRKKHYDHLKYLLLVKNYV